LNNLISSSFILFILLNAVQLSIDYLQYIRTFFRYTIIDETTLALFKGKKEVDKVGNNIQRRFDSQGPDRAFQESECGSKESICTAYEHIP
jgi:hypothetical protein